MYNCCIIYSLIIVEFDSLLNHGEGRNDPNRILRHDKWLLLEMKPDTKTKGETSCWLWPRPPDGQCHDRSAHPCSGPCILGPCVGSDEPIPRYTWRRSAGPEWRGTAAGSGCSWWCKRLPAPAGSVAASRRLRKNQKWRLLLSLEKDDCVR